MLEGSFSVANNVSFNLFNILTLAAFAYCVIKIFFAVRPYGRIGIAC